MITRNNTFHFTSTKSPLIFLRSRGLRARTVLRLTVRQLPNSRDYRGPSLHHWLTGFTVYEFIENILTGDM